MSWDHQAYSFGSPNAQPPTPTQTPTSGTYPSPIFQTPRGEALALDDHTGWTPTFAEEYSVFNATPGRLTSTGTQFADISTPRPSTASSQRGPISTTIELEAELASHVHHSIETDLPLPPVDPSHRLPSSPQDSSLHGTKSGEKKSLTTPRKPRRQLEEAFNSGQTATPPQSATKSSRKLAPKPQSGTMQANQELPQMSSGSQGLPNPMNFATGPDEIYAYSMAGPATAPLYTNTKIFWDPDSSMSGMDMDIDFDAGNNSLFEPGLSNRASNSVDWGRNNQMFQDSVNMQIFNGDVGQASHGNRSIDSKDNIPGTVLNSSISNFGFGSSTLSEDPFAVVASSGAVNPGLLFAFPDLSSNVTDPELDPPLQGYSQPNARQIVRKPYQHQERESMRDQEEHRRSRTNKEISTATRHDKTSFSSPAKKSGRPSLQRSASDSRTKSGTSRRPGQPSTIASRPPTAETREKPIRRKASPLKHQSRTSLSSIPESVSGTRTSLTFSIDANGRARTETKIIVEEPIIKRRLSSPLSEDWSSSHHSDSSTDEDPIILPSRNTSFSLPPRRLDGPKLGHFSTSRQSFEGCRGSTEDLQRSTNVSSSVPRQTQPEEQESEAETVIDDYDGSGDATAALRKIMENRKQGAVHRGSSQPHFNHNNMKRRSSSSHATPYKDNQQHYNSTSSINLSPTTVSDPDLATPSTDRESSRSDSTRCICNNRDGDDGFMIQCESCEKWLHAKCVGISRHRLPNVYICAFCAQTPNMRGGRIREPIRGDHHLGSSPLAHKSFKSWHQ